MAFCISISMKSSYREKKGKKLHITRLYGNRVTKHHYKSLKRHNRFIKTPLRALEFFFFITRFLENRVSKEGHFPN